MKKTNKAEKLITIQVMLPEETVKTLRQHLKKIRLPLSPYLRDKIIKITKNINLDKNCSIN